MLERILATFDRAQIGWQATWSHVSAGRREVIACVFEFSLDVSSASCANERARVWILRRFLVYLSRLEILYKVANEMSRVRVAINLVIERGPSLLRILSECNLISWVRRVKLCVLYPSKPYLGELTTAIEREGNCGE